MLDALLGCRSKIGVEQRRFHGAIVAQKVLQSFLNFFGILGSLDVT
jgi:hypothetical protein